MNIPTICIASQNWSNRFQNDAAYLMSTLAITSKVLFVNPQPTLNDVFTTALYGADRLGFRLNSSTRLTEVTLQHGASLYVLQPRPRLPISWLTKLGSADRWIQLNARRLLTDIQQAMSQLGIEWPTVINMGQPALGLSLRGCLNEYSLIYYCNKDVSSDSRLLHDAQAEPEFIKQANAVITTSKALFETKCTFAKQIFMIPRGIDFDFFHQAVNLRASYQQEYKSWAIRSRKPLRKVVGIICPVDQHLDVDLLQHCFKFIPNTDFWFIGPILDKHVEQKLRTWPTAWLLGRQPIASLPELLAKMDVIILPFVCHSYIPQLDSLFINELLAAGLPIVATPFTDLSDFTDTIDITSSKATFLQLLDNTLAEPDFGLTFRLATAYENDWRSRAKSLRLVIEEEIAHNQLIL